MSSSERAAQLRQLADYYDTVGALEEEAAAAKAAYGDAPDDAEAKAAHRTAAAALREARREARDSGLLVGDSSPGSVTITPQAIQGKVG